MSEYTPTTEQVREDYASRMAPHLDEARREAFDRWLKQIRAEAWNEGHYASNTEWEHTYYGHPVSEGEICPECSTGNPYRKEQDK